MLTKSRFVALLFLLAAGAKAQDAYGPDAPRDPNHFFIHPILTGLTLAIEEVPTFLQVTYERNLEDGNSSVILSPQLIFGKVDHGEGIESSQFSVASYVGYRRYFRNGDPKGFYLQGSGAFSFGSASAEQTGNPDKAKATATAFGGLGYLGYRWTHVFLDLGLGLQQASGTLKFDNGREVELTASGLALDLNLGFGF